MLGNSSFSQNGAKPTLGSILKKSVNVARGIQDPIYGITSLLNSKKKQPQAPAPIQQSPYTPVSPKTTNTVANKPKTPTSGLLATSQKAPAKTTTQPVTNTANAPAPAAIDAASNARRVIQTGAQTPLEKSATERVYQAGQATPMEQEYIQRVQKAQGMQNAGMLGGYAQAGQYANQSPEQLYANLIQAPDLVGRAGANQGLYDAFSNIYGSQATQGLLAANTIAGRGMQGAESGLTNAQAIGERARGGAESVLSAGLPATAPYTSYRYDPLTGQTIGSASPFEGGQQAGMVALGQQYPELMSAHVQSQGIKNTIQEYLTQNPSLNPSDVSLVNSALQWAQGKQLGDPKYQTLINYLNEYTNTLAPILGVGGSVTNLKTEIANSFVNAAAGGQSIAQVLEDIDRLAEGKLESMANVGAGLNQPSNIGTSSGGGGFAEAW